MFRISNLVLKTLRSSSVATHSEAIKYTSLCLTQILLTANRATQRLKFKSEDLACQVDRRPVDDNYKRQSCILRFKMQPLSPAPVSLPMSNNTRLLPRNKNAHVSCHIRITLTYRRVYKQTGQIQRWNFRQTLPRRYYNLLFYQSLWLSAPRATDVKMMSLITCWAEMRVETKSPEPDVFRTGNASKHGKIQLPPNWGYTKHSTYFILNTLA